MRPVPKPQKIRSEKIMAYARGPESYCTLRLPGVCTHDDSTVCGCHLPGHAKGTGTKEDDIHIAFGCRACHDVIDGRAKSGLSGAIILDAMLRGLSETQHRLWEAGLLGVPEDAR